MNDEKGFFAELFTFARENWMWWALPIALVLLLLLFAVLAGSGEEGGFVYPLF